MLKADFDGDSLRTAAEFGMQPRDRDLATMNDDGASNDDGGRINDLDDDGLIEVNTVEQLNAIRYDLDGDGKPSAGDEVAYVAAFGIYAEDTSGIRCRGYELTVNIDLSSIANWEPIGGGITVDSQYTAIFEGNGNTISNLTINRPDTDEVGLFGVLGIDGIIRNVGLVEVEVIAPNYVASLAGRNEGTIISSYATGTVEGDGSVGGLVGQNEGTITASYVMSAVSGSDYVGGLVGDNLSGGSITFSYAMGSVTGDNDVGGLVGRNAGELTASYVPSNVVTGTSGVGGLVGTFTNSPTNSYYYAGATVMADGAPVDPDPALARSASFLSALPASSAGWGELVDVDDDAATLDDQYQPWDFRDANYEYPVLRPAPRGATSATWEDFGTQFHAPVVCFDAESDTLEELDVPMKLEVGVTMYNAPRAETTVRAIIRYEDSTATADDFLSSFDDGVLLTFGVVPSALSATMNDVFTASFNFYLNNDAVPEGDETFVFALVDLSPGVTLGNPSLMTVTIPANDLYWIVSFSGVNLTTTVSEGDDTVNFVVELDYPAMHELVIPIIHFSLPSRINSDPLSVDDCTYDKEMIFAPGQMESTLTVTIVDDELVEKTENAVFRFGSLPDDVSETINSRKRSRKLEVRDNEKYEIEFSVNAGTFVEDSFVEVEVEVSISPAPGAGSVSPVVIPITLLSDIATLSEADCTYVKSVTFADGELTSTFLIDIVDDDLMEEDEFVDFTFGTLPNYVMSEIGTTPMYRLTVEDDDGYVVSFSVDTKAVDEGVGSVAVAVLIDHAPAPDTSVTIPIIINSGTLTAADCTYDKTVTFAAGQMESTFNVTIEDDDLAESDEYVVFAFDAEDLPNHVEVGSPDTSRLIVEDNDSYEVSFSVDTGTVDEGVGSVPVVVRIDPVPALDTSITIPIVVNGGTLTAADCTYDKTVTFAAGQMESTFNVTIHEDLEVEEDESAVFTFDADADTLPDDVVVGSPDTYTLVVEDNDTYEVSFSIDAGTVAEDAGTVNVLVSISPTPNTPLDIPIIVDRDTRTLSDDDCTYVDVVHFDIDDPSSSFSVTIHEDLLAEGDEYVVFTFDADTLPAGVMVGSPDTYTLVVEDNDSYRVSFSETSKTVGEANDFTVFVLVEMLIAPAPAPGTSITIPIIIDRDTRTLSGDDCTYEKFVTFAADEMSGSFVIAILHDDLPEYAESAEFTFDTSALPGVFSGSQDTYVLTVSANDHYEVEFSVAADTVDESVGSVEVAVSIDPAPVLGASITIPIKYTSRTLEDGDCTYDKDVTFAAGQVERTFNVTIVDDDEPEDDEFVTFAFDEDAFPAVVKVNVDGQRWHTLTVSANDTYEVSFSVAAATVDEDAGTVEVEVLIDPAPPLGTSFTIPIRRPYVADNDDTLTEYFDYRYVGEVYFAPTQERSTFDVFILEDEDEEDDEFVTFVFDGANLPAAVVVGSPDQHVLTVTDNDGLPDYAVEFSIASQTVAEDAGTVEVAVQITPAPAPGTSFTIPIIIDSRTLEDGDCTYDKDVIFAAGQMERTFNVTIHEDLEAEDDESVTFGFDTSALSEDVVVGSQATYILTVTDNDTYEVSFSIDTSTVDEGVATVEVAVFLDHAHSTTPITIPIIVNGGGTLTAADCTYDKTVIFAADQVESTFNVTIYEDLLVEGDESAVFAFDTSAFPEDVVVVVGSTGQHTLTVEDNDYEVFFSHDSMTVAEDAGIVEVLVSISPAPSKALDIPIIVDRDTRTLSDDDCTYEDVVHFDIGETSSSFNVTIVDDVEIEVDESVTFGFGEIDLLSNIVVGSPDQHVLTVTDNDTYEVNFTKGTTAVAEGDGTVEVEVFLDHAPTTTSITIPIVADIVDADMDDFTYEKFVTFTPDQDRSSFSVTINDDGEVEGDNVVHFNFEEALPDGVVVGLMGRLTMVIEDNDKYEVEFSIASGTVAEDAGTVEVLVSISPVPTASITIPIVVDASSTATKYDCTIPVPSSVTFEEGDSSMAYVVIILDDVEVEESESVTFRFDETALKNKAVNVVAGSTDQHTLTVTDNDDYRVSFSVPSVTVAEDVGTVRVPVSISPVPSIDLTIPIKYTNRTLENADCTYDKFVYFSPDQELSSFSVTINDDDEIEGGEFVEFAFDTSALSDVLGGSEPTCRLTVTDNDGSLNYAVEFSVDVDTVAEDAGTVEVLVSISPAPNTPLAIPIIVSASTLTVDDDCTYDSMVSFSPGQMSSSFSVYIVDDVEVEESESVTFGFDETALPTDVVLGSQVTYLLTVTDNDDYAVEFSVDAGTVVEGIGTVRVPVSIYPVPKTSFDIPITVSAFTLTLTDDYTYDSVVHFAAGELSSSFSVTIEDDLEVEESESVTFGFDTSALPEDVVLGDQVTCHLTVEDNDNYEVDFSIASQTVAEGIATAYVEVLLSGIPFPISADIDIDIMVEGRTLSGDDCTYEKNVTFTADQSPTTSGELSSSFAVTIVDDVEVEDSEDVEFAFDTSTLPEDVVVGSRNQHILTVEDNDDYEVEFSVDAGTVAEGVETAYVEVLLSGTPLPISANIDIIVNFSTLSGDDCTYEKNVTFSAGQSLTTSGGLSSSFAVTIVDDELVENSEHVVFAFNEETLPADVVVGSRDRHTLTVTDNDDYAVSFLNPTGTVDEGIETVRVPVSISPVPTTSFDIPVIVSASTLTLDDDYTYDSMVSFSPGQERSSFDVTIVDDEEKEGSEYVDFTFDTSALPDVLGGISPTCRLTVTDNDGTIYTVSFSDPSSTFDEFEGTVEVLVSIDPVPSKNLAIPIKVSTSTLTKGDDCTYVDVVHFAPAQESSSFNVTIVDDDLVEGDEFVTFGFDEAALSADVVLGSQVTHTLTVEDDDNYVVSFSSSAGTFDEFEGTVNVEVSIDPAPSTDLPIPIIIGSGTHTLSAADCTYDDMVVFAAGRDRSSFNVYIVDDKLVEESESVTFTFDVPEDVVLGSPSTYFLLIEDDDDYAVEFSIDAGTVAEDAGTVEVEVSISPVPTTSLDIPIIVSASTLTKDDDCTYDSVVHFDAGDPSSSFNVYIVDDDLVEGDEFVTFTFGDEDGNLPENVEAGGQTTYTLTVEDNDNYVVSFVDPSSGFMESDSEGLVFVSIFPEVPVTASPITILIIFDEGTRTLTGADCTYEKEVIFNPGDSERSFAVTIVDDDLVEGDESVTFGFDLGLLSGTVVPSTTASTTHTLTVEDDDYYAVSFREASLIVGEDVGIVEVMVTIDPAPSETLEIPIVVNGGTLTGADYTYNGTLTIPAESDIAIFRVIILDDDLVEETESAEFAFNEETLPADVVVGTQSTYTLTVTDIDEYEVSFLESETAFDEDGSGTDVRVFVDIFPSPYAGTDPLEIPIVVNGGGTLSADDYTFVTPVTFNPGESLAASLVIDVVDDDFVEEDEFVEFTFGDLPPRVAESTTGGNLTYTLTVRNDDNYVVDFSIASQTVEEDAGTVFVEVSVDPVPSTNLTIPIVVNSGGTLSADDYVPATSVIILADQMTGTFEVVILDDTLGEVEEYVDFLFGDADGNLPDNVVRGTQTTYQLRVTSNDGPPPPPDYTVSFSAGTLTVAEDVGTVEVEVFLSDGTLPLTDDITIPITVVGGTLTGADCTYEKEVIFTTSLVPTTPGQLMSSFTVTIYDDDLVEGDESVTFGFDLGLLSGAVVPSTTESTTHTLTVEDDDLRGIIS